MTPESAANALKEMSKLFKCSYEMAWKPLQRGRRWSLGKYMNCMTKIIDSMVNVSVNELQKMGYVKRIDHSKKAEEFFNTSEGQEWIQKNRFINAM
jgi:hypothetical protein